MYIFGAQTEMESLTFRPIQPQMKKSYQIIKNRALLISTYFWGVHVLYIT